VASRCQRRRRVLRLRTPARWFSARQSAALDCILQVSALISPQQQGRGRLRRASALGTLHVAQRSGHSTAQERAREHPRRLRRRTRPCRGRTRRGRSQAKQGPDDKLTVGLLADDDALGVLDICRRRPRTPSQRGAGPVPEALLGDLERPRGASMSRSTIAWSCSVFWPEPAPEREATRIVTTLPLRVLPPPQAHAKYTCMSQAPCAHRVLYTQPASNRPCPGGFCAN